MIMRRICVLLVILAVAFSISSCGLIHDGFLYIGDGWQKTPAEALAKAADTTIDEQMRLTPKEVLDTIYIDDIAIMIFVSEADTLVYASFVTNDKGEYHHHGYSEEYDLAAPDTFLLDGDPAQRILSHCEWYGDTAFGFKYSSAKLTYGGAVPNIKTYTFSCQGKEHSIDYWWIDGVTDDMVLEIVE